jgi:hypothetical protein
MVDRLTTSREMESYLSYADYYTAYTNLNVLDRSTWYQTTLDMLQVVKKMPRIIISNTVLLVLYPFGIYL